jgi:PAS domain S-box-containing protein
MHHREGHWVWIRDRGRIVEWDRQGKPVRMVGTHEDVTELVNAREALARSERRFKAMFANHDAVMLLVDPESGTIVDANAAASRFYGYDLEKLRGMNIGEINVLPAAEIARRRKAAAKGDQNYFVFPHRLADGTVRKVDVHSSPIEDQGRTLLFSIIRDVTLITNPALGHPE